MGLMGVRFDEWVVDGCEFDGCLVVCQCVLLHHRSHDWCSDLGCVCNQSDSNLPKGIAILVGPVRI